MFPKLDPFIVETEWAHPVPSEKPPFGGTHKERWDKIRSLLTYVDAKHVRVGGIYLSINSAAEPLIDPREDVGCVNLAWKELSKSVGLEVLPAFGDGLVRGAPTTAREGGEQLREFLKSESEIRRGTVITEESRNARRSR